MPKHRLPAILTLGDLEVLFQPKVIKEVAGRRRQGRTVVIGLAAPRKVATDELRDPTSAETAFASYFDFGRPRILKFFLAVVFFPPKCPLKGRGPQPQGPKHSNKDRGV